MKIVQGVGFIVVLAILIAHGVWPNIFVLDKASILLIFILAIPIIAPYLEKAKIFGAEFVFKEEIKKLDADVQKSERISREAAKKGSKQIEVFKTFSTASAKQLIKIDPSLALAALRIEIERVLSSAVKRIFNVNDNVKYSNKYYIDKLWSNKIIFHEQAESLKTIIDICNRAVHGVEVSREMAEEIIALTDRLNKSISVGYSINFKSNSSYHAQGMFCEWEHCIEHSPLREMSSELSCPVFGHDCPGGLETRSLCNKKIDDIPKSRFNE
ncbi:MAG: hypothetical protein WC491_06250 [Candidatus Omnitrophota bacterium]